MLKLTSPVFVDGGTIPAEYTCDGKRYLNPPLLISGVPEGTESLILVMDDPDIPESIKQQRGIEKFDHWVLYNIVPSTREINEEDRLGTTGLNSAGNAEYTGPCPPTDIEPTEHRYIFRLYAVTGTLNFIKAPTLDEVEIAAKGMMIESATLTARYKRP
ncbi:YbhB/YbcL family Raf kinase inhibitor-like protein [Candidatus Parcubacteria bacterium]|uniref:YbhB/YbcL family Raf kinase inhibitor-like protein n=1 Tax=Candidatus Kaiserbacteria bacterium CG10_big_fil_rev_8_21_14_0_10_47_16 TaxID=1974608 RepID=A0A2H0UE07_9BACT|nr:YbhB/YbcL family Raf kinase inhibitor-like protein [Candidatus Parcubacteria bacterium]PIR84654.1 MAG: YbhB/YbcL family Raf kinase inhibitor-like protein [Candidatus Kaiserbacteria bacterium CG10_big_fil_rev_8_21_14_0_10_47_16]